MAEVDAPGYRVQSIFRDPQPGSSVISMPGLYLGGPAGCVNLSGSISLIFAVGSYLSHLSVVGRLHCFGHTGISHRPRIPGSTTRVLRGKRCDAWPDPVRSRPLPTFLPVSYHIENF